MRIKILFICSQNKWRSLTAEKIFAHKQGFHVSSAGTNSKARVKVTAGMIGWADVIVVMEKKHRNYLQVHFKDLLAEKDLHVLHIPDEYPFMDEQLIELLEEKMMSILEW